MRYLARQAPQRKDPAAILPGARVAVVTLTNYHHAPAPAHPEAGCVAQYAWSRDYHAVLHPRLEALAAAIETVAPGAATRCYVDAGPVPERELAQRAGLGWIGKNTLLLNPQVGSFTFIGVVLTDADLAADLPFAADRCGSCRRCLDACPCRRVRPHRTCSTRGGASPTSRSTIAGTSRRRRPASSTGGCLGAMCARTCVRGTMRFADETTDPELAAAARARAPRGSTSLLAAAPAEAHRALSRHGPRTRWSGGIAAERARRPPAGGARPLGRRPATLRGPGPRARRDPGPPRATPRAPARAARATARP